MPKRLLILACSQRKRPDRDLLPAIERYNGPQFQVLRKFLREGSENANNLSVHIISAQFGLISSNKPIQYYDCRMTQERARTLHSQVLCDFKSILQADCYDELFVGLGKAYLETISGYEQFVPTDLETFLSRGSMGRRQVELRDWLYTDLAEAQTAPTTAQSKTRIRGVEITPTQDQIFDLARKKLSDDQKGADSYQAWYVQIEDKQVAPKWLVSQLTGLPVSSFHSQRS